MHQKISALTSFLGLQVRGLGPAAAADSEFQLILHTIDELLGQRDAGGPMPTAAKQDHLAKLGRQLLRRLHQQAAKLPEPDTLLLTHKYLHLRRCLAAARPAARPGLTNRPDLDWSYQVKAAASGPISGPLSSPGPREASQHRGLVASTGVRALPADTSRLSHSQLIQQDSPGRESTDSDEYTRAVLAGELDSGSEPDGLHSTTTITTIRPSHLHVHDPGRSLSSLAVPRRADKEGSPIAGEVDRDGLLWDAPVRRRTGAKSEYGHSSCRPFAQEVSGTLAWEARRLLKTFQANGGDGLAVGPGLPADVKPQRRRRQQQRQSRDDTRLRGGGGGGRRGGEGGGKGSPKSLRQASKVYSRSAVDGYNDSREVYDAVRPKASTIRHANHQQVGRGLRELRTPETGGGGGGGGLVRGKPVSLATWDRSVGDGGGRGRPGRW